MRRTPLLLISLALLAGCKEKEPDFVSPVAFDTAKAAWIRTSQGDSIPLLLELAKTEQQRTFGLMARPRLDSMSGMVFLYDSIQPGSSGFWM